MADRIDVLAEEIRELKWKKEKSISILDFFDVHYVSGGVTPDLVLRYVKFLAPPENPTSDQITAYLEKAVKFKDYKYSRIIHSEIMVQLNKVGRRRLDAMLPFMDKNNAVAEVVQELATTEDKPVIVKYVKTPNVRVSSRLANIYNTMLDESDKEVILYLLPKEPYLLLCFDVDQLFAPGELLPLITGKLLTDSQFNRADVWIKYVYNHLDRQAYKKFQDEFWRKHFVYNPSSHGSFTYPTFQLLPYGFLPAFHYLARHIDIWSQDTHMRDRFLQYTPANNHDDFKKWYNVHGEDIVFDENSGLFTVPNTRKLAK